MDISAVNTGPNTPQPSSGPNTTDSLPQNPNQSTKSLVDISSHDEKARSTYKTEEHIKEVLTLMLDLLAIDIEPNKYPSISIEENEGNSKYNTLTNKISINIEDVGDGFIWGEEIMHWIRHTLTKDIDDQVPNFLKLSLVEEKNVHEFFGYIGRQLAYQATTNSQLIQFFNLESIEAPQGATLESLREKQQGLTKMQNAHSEFNKNLADLPSYETISQLGDELFNTAGLLSDENCQNNLSKIHLSLKNINKKIDSILLVDSLTVGDWPEKVVEGIRDCGRVIDQTCSILASVENSGIPSTKLDETKQALEKIISGLATQLNKYSNILADLELSSIKNITNIFITAHSQYHHLAGYASAIIFMQEQDNLVETIRNLLPCNSTTINANFIKFNTDLTPRTWLSSVLAKSKAFIANIL